jgi:hypothetical protein
MVSIPAVSMLLFLMVDLLAPLLRVRDMFGAIIPGLRLGGRPSHPIYAHAPSTVEIEKYHLCGFPLTSLELR